MAFNGASGVRGDPHPEEHIQQAGNSFQNFRDHCIRGNPSRYFGGVSSPFNASLKRKRQRRFFTVSL